MEQLFSDRGSEALGFHRFNHRLPKTLNASIRSFAKPSGETVRHYIREFINLKVLIDRIRLQNVQEGKDAQIIVGDESIFPDLAIINYSRGKVVRIPLDIPVQDFGNIKLIAAGRFIKPTQYINEALAFGMQVVEKVKSFTEFRDGIPIKIGDQEIVLLL